MRHLKLVLVLAFIIGGANVVSAQTKTAAKKEIKKAKVYSCPMKCEGSKTYDKPGKCPKCNMNFKAKSMDATTAMYQCPMKCEGEKTYAKAGKCPVCNMNLKTVNKEAVAANYQCPMKCEGDKIYTEAGKCPKCNMNLKDVTAAATDEHKGHKHN